MIHDPALAADLDAVRAVAAPRTTERQPNDAAGWLCFALAVAIFAMIVVRGWIALAQPS